ncbi:MAG: DHH family phosphoesterase [Bdellovibrionota bacterium]
MPAQEQNDANKAGAKQAEAKKAPLRDTVKTHNANGGNMKAKDFLSHSLLPQIEIIANPKIEPVSFESSLIEAIKNSNNVVLIGHLLPDEDCVGSLVFVKEVLEKIGKKVSVVLQDGVPRGFKVLNGTKDIINDIKIDLEGASSFDLAIYLDCDRPERGGEETMKKLTKAETKVISIDHHFKNNRFKSNDSLSIVGNKVCMRKEATSTCEAVYHLAEALGVDISLLTKEALCGLYHGIKVDTSDFKKNSQNTMKIKERLEKLCTKETIDRYLEDFGEYAKCPELEKRFLENKKSEKLKNGISVLYTYIDQKDIEALGVATADAGKRAKYLSNEKDDFLIYILQKRDGYDISIRTSEGSSYKNMAKFILESAIGEENVGGHKERAGGFIKKGIKKFQVKDMINVILRTIEDIGSVSSVA